MCEGKVTGHTHKHTRTRLCGNEDNTHVGVVYETAFAIAREISRLALAAFFSDLIKGQVLRELGNTRVIPREMGGKKTIVDVRVKDLEKWRFPNKHYVRTVTGWLIMKWN